MSGLTWELLLERALSAGASDLHVRVDADQRGVVRARLDGVLIPWGELPAHVMAPALTRMRSEANLSTGTALLVGEGRISHRMGDSLVDLRLTITPLVGGALKLVLRLPAIASNLTLPELGFAPGSLQKVQQLLSIPDGLLLTTGPVGSGKTTTMLAALQAVGGPGKAVITVEDPVERVVPGADQIEVNEPAGLTYEHVLRSLLRMDMDALLIGEIRDPATARHAVQIAKAGRMVLSTLHAGSAVGAVLRLHELSGLGALEIVEPLRGVISQRLLRCIHHNCEGRGCGECLGTGWSGRVAIHEVLTVTPEFIDALINRASLRDLEHLALSEGMTSLREDSRRWVDSGVTTEAEVARVLGDV